MKTLHTFPTTKKLRELDASRRANLREARRALKSGRGWGVAAPFLGRASLASVELERYERVRAEVPLGFVVGLVRRFQQRAAEARAMDAAITLGSDCEEIIANAERYEAHQLVRFFGFKSYGDFLDECAERTSSRFVYFSGLWEYADES